MKPSSAQLRLDLDTNAKAGDNVGVAPAAPPSTGSIAGFPEFGQYGSAFAETSKLAGRINAASVTPSEYDELLLERQRLLDKKFNNDFSRRDEIRLEYIRWSLDRVEDAKSGLGLELLMGRLEEYEQFQRDLDHLLSQLHGHLPRRRRRK